MMCFKTNNLFARSHGQKTSNPLVPGSARGEPAVTIRLKYRQYVPPVWDVSDETVERAQEIPVPAEWREIEASAQQTQNGETFDRRYRVPESFGPEDLEAWMNGPQWAAPASGAPFGKIEVDYCKERRSAAYACSAMVVGTQRVPGQQSSGPIESVSATLNAEGTVRVHWERNG